MGKFSSGLKITARKAGRIKRVSATVLFIVLCGLLVLFTHSASSSMHRKQPHHSSSPGADSQQSNLEGWQKGGHVNVDTPTRAISQSDVVSYRNDSNDGSCTKLRRRYPDLLPGEAEGIKRNRFAVVTYSDGLGSKTGHYCKVRANHCAYAEADGAADCIDNRNLEMCMGPLSLQSFHLIHPAAWAKISLMQHCCQHYEYVLLLDADLIVMDYKKYPLRRFVEESNARNKDLTFTGTGMPKTPINSGLMGMRCPNAVAGGTRDEARIGEEFLSKTLANSKSISWRMNGLWEQRTMRKLYLENQKFRDGILLVLPERETQCSPKRGECSADDFTIHFLGDKTKYETQFLRYFCESRTSAVTVDDIRKSVC